MLTASLDSGIAVAAAAIDTTHRREGAQDDAENTLDLSTGIHPTVIWPLHDIVIANIVWCVAYTREVGGTLKFVLTKGVEQKWADPEDAASISNVLRQVKKN